MEPNIIYHDTYSQDEIMAMITLIPELQKHPLVKHELLKDKDTLVHFLRARKLDIQKAKTMLLNYLQWRIDYKVDTILADFVFDKTNELSLLYPHIYHKTTKAGFPIFIQILGDLKADELFKLTTPENLLKYSIRQYEEMQKIIFPACSKAYKKYIHNMCSIIDIKRINNSFLNKNIFNHLQGDLNVCQNYYPECLGECFIINAGIVSMALYSICKPFLDSKTKEKIKVIGEDYESALLEKIDKANLPKVLGGECTCEPEGCMFSFAGPWKTKDNPPIDPELQRKRNEVMNVIAQAKGIELFPNQNEKKIDDKNIQIDESK